ncbi:MAG: hypothetical protein BWZ10_02724 [candidate division BRC1 bacterium ADurb.BinA364]|nr:MAG: hypothetical protein BWZ10_02724 [candidate division BRC1 bacterium ADurb.BinA364]
MIKSPSEANDAIVPPVVGFVKTVMNGMRALPSRAAAALVLAICISERMPSCMRAPPPQAMTITGFFSASPRSMARVTFSPTTEPMLPPAKVMSITAALTLKPWISPTPVTHASFRPELA